MDFFRGKRVLITGGLGFIGSNLAARLVGLGAGVVLVDSLIPQYGGNLANIAGIRDRVTVNIADVRDPHAMKFLVRDQDVLFNLAGQTSHMDSMTDPLTDLEINARAQLFILEACRKNNPEVRIVYAGTRQIYGKPDRLPVDETHPIRPVDVNGVNKAAGENYHLLYNQVYGLKTAVLRLTNTYGPGMRIKDARQTFLGVWVRLALEEKPFEVWDGPQLRDYTYIDDCVEAFLLAAAADFDAAPVFNLGGSEALSLVETAETLKRAGAPAGFVVKPYPAERKKIDIGDYYADCSRIRAALGWTPKVALHEGLVRTLGYYRPRLADYR